MQIILQHKTTKIEIIRHLNSLILCGAQCNLLAYVTRKECQDLS